MGFDAFEHAWWSAILPDSRGRSIEGLGGFVAGGMDSSEQQLSHVDVWKRASGTGLWPVPGGSPTE
jgi:hypothetical protein